MFAMFCLWQMQSPSEQLDEDEYLRPVTNTDCEKQTAVCCDQSLVLVRVIVIFLCFFTSHIQFLVYVQHRARLRYWGPVPNGHGVPLLCHTLLSLPFPFVSPL